MNKPKLTGARCQCCVCNEVFSSERAFDRHRVGEHGKDRRCLTPPEMVSQNMRQQSTGIWANVPLGRAYSDLEASPNPIPTSDLR